MQKRGFEMSFGMIFSIIIIAVTIFVAIYVIGIFLDRVEQMKVVNDMKTLDSEIDSAADATQSLKVVTLDAPKGTTYLCFVNMSKSLPSNDQQSIDLRKFYSASDNNVFFYPLKTAEKYGTKTAWKILCGSNTNGKECIYPSKNPLCIPNVNGQFRFTVENSGDYSGKINIKTA